MTEIIQLSKNSLNKQIETGTSNFREAELVNLIVVTQTIVFFYLWDINSTVSARFNSTPIIFTNVSSLYMYLCLSKISMNNNKSYDIIIIIIHIRTG